MTKRVRIENADTSEYKLRVEVWDENATGGSLAEAHDLDYPTSMAEVCIHSGRYLVVKEKK